MSTGRRVSSGSVETAERGGSVVAVAVAVALNAEEAAQRRGPVLQRVPRVRHLDSDGRKQLRTQLVAALPQQHEHD
jgi:hypothetical protein